jgi:hypothetical protein
VIAVVAVAAALLPSASAQDEAYIGGDHGIPVTIEGGLAVDVRGDATTGCAASGLCGIGGTITWTPGGRGVLFAARSAGGRRRPADLLVLDHNVAAAHIVRRAPDGALHRCTDVVEFDTRHAWIDVRGSGRALTVRLPGPAHPPIRDVLATHCAGPLQLDLRAALPGRTLDRATLARGRTTVDLRGDRPFAAGGLAGTVHSTLVLRLGRPGRDPYDDRSRRGERRRALTATYTIEGIDGTVASTFAGPAEPALCVPLDACGLAGTVTSTPGPIRAGRLTLTAVTYDRRRTWRDLRAALGLARRGRSRDINVTGSGSWRGSGTTTASVTRADGSAPCRDSAALTGGTLLVREGLLFYVPAPEPLRTRCPGPRGSGVNFGEANIARPLTGRALRRRRVTVRIADRFDLTSDGYTGRTRAELSIVLRRIGVRRHTVADGG